VVELAIVVAIAYASIRRAHADPRRACFDAVAAGQALRDEGKLTEARNAFVTCAAATCPLLLQHDCQQWIADVDGRMPTVVVTATDADGRELLDVRVLVDGRELKPRIDGIAAPVDPGVHMFRFEPVGADPVEQRVVVRDGEKFQKLRVVLPKRAPGPSQPATPPTPPTPPPTPSPTPRDPGLPVSAIVIGSVGVVALGAFGYFAIVGTSDVHHLDATCSPNCPHSDAEAARRELVFADVALGVSVVAAGVAAWLYLEWRSHASAATSAIAPGPAGATVRF
jgi:hypothetical protein